MRTYLRSMLLVGLCVSAPVGMGAQLPAPTSSALPVSPTTAAELATARAAYRASVAASQQQRWDSARTHLDRALKLWPSHPTYVRALALIAARQHDTAGVVTGARRYAALGLRLDPAMDSALAPFAALPRMADAVSLLAANAKPWTQSRVERELADSTTYPEGVTHDPRTGSYFVASIRNRTIVEVKADGVVRELIPRWTPRIGAMFGVRIDPTRPALWATTAGIPQMDGYTPADSSIAAILRLSAHDGRIEQRYEVPAAAAGHVLGDLLVSPRGDVFVTDSRSPNVYIIERGRDSVRTITHPLFRSLQGVVATNDGNDLIVADYANGLLRVHLKNDSVIRLAEPEDVTTLGIDGIAMVGDDVIAIQNGLAPPRVARFTLDSARTRVVRGSVLDRNFQVATEPTIGTIVGDAFVYVANSQWDLYGEDGVLRAGVRLPKPVLLRLPLR